MEDTEIISLYQRRLEAAISSTSIKYGRLLYKIAYNILSNHEDSEEAVNDTYSKAWDTIPPQKPNSLRAYLGRITRNRAINLWHKNKAKKRSAGAELLLSELGDCIPSTATVEAVVETKELARIIDHWLSTLPPDDRILFLRRYWFGDALKQLATECGSTPNKLAGRMYRLRQDLKAKLEGEGIWL